MVLDSYDIAGIFSGSDRRLADEIIDSLPFGIALLDEKADIIKTNRQWERFSDENGLPDSYQCVGKNYLEICQRSNDPEAEEVTRGLRELMQGERASFELEYPCHGPDEKRWFMLNITSLEFENSRFYLVAHLDITDRKLSELQLEKFAELTHNNPVGLMILEASDRNEHEFTVTELNPRAEAVFGADRESIIGQPIETIVEDIEESGLVDDAETVLSSGETIENREYRSTDSQSQQSVWDVRFFPIRKDCVGVAFEDVTATVNSREQLQYLATHDELTGLSNRSRFMTELKDEYKRAKRYGSEFSLMLMDLDHFKRINDTYGHLAGDQALSEVADIILDTIRDTDFAGRYGGEEFGILLPETAEDQARRLGDRLRKNIASHEFSFNDTTFQVTCSLGISMVCTSDEDMNELIQRADQALYKCKKEGRDQVVVYHEGIDSLDPRVA
jgi:diguanylate cyclase (GGDEF)-like protein/PAS domain S-box-containing protein